MFATITDPAMDPLFGVIETNLGANEKFDVTILLFAGTPN